MKKTINYSTLRIDANKKKVFYYTNEEYNLLRNVSFESLKNIDSKSPEHYKIFRELLFTNHPEEFL